MLQATVHVTMLTSQSPVTSMQVRSSEERLGELDRANKELTDHKYRSEAAIRELKTKLRAAEEVLKLLCIVHSVMLIYRARAGVLECS